MEEPKITLAALRAAVASLTDPPKFKTCPHLAEVLDRRKADKVIQKCIRLLRDSNLEFDTIAYSGNSGALIAPILAHYLCKELILVRKPGLDCYSRLSVEGHAAAKRYIIVDDMICSSNTNRRIVQAVDLFARGAELVAIFLYTSCTPLHLPGGLVFHELQQALSEPAEWNGEYGNLLTKYSTKSDNKVLADPSIASDKQIVSAWSDIPTTEEIDELIDSALEGADGPNIPSEEV